MKTTLGTEGEPEICMCARQRAERVLKGSLSLLVCRNCGGLVTKERNKPRTVSGGGRENA